MTRRPRREWKSFSCDFRCSVRLLMRSLRTATCTSGEPVSLGFLAYSWMTACLRSAVIDIVNPLRLLKVQHAYRTKIAALETRQRHRLAARHGTHQTAAFEMADALQILAAEQAHRLAATQAVRLGIGQGQGRDVVQRGLDR